MSEGDHRKVSSGMDVPVGDDNATTGEVSQEKAAGRTVSARLWPREDFPGVRSGLSTQTYFLVAFVPLIVFFVAFKVLGYWATTLGSWSGWAQRGLAVGEAVVLGVVFVLLLFQESGQSHRHRIRTGVLSMTLVQLATLWSALFAFLMGLALASHQDMFGEPQSGSPVLALPFFVLAVLEVLAPFVGGMLIIFGRSRRNYLFGVTAVVTALFLRFILEVFFLLAGRPL